MKLFYSLLFSVIPNRVAKGKLLLPIFTHEFWNCELFAEKFKKIFVLAAYMAATFFIDISCCSAQNKAKQEPQSIAQIAGNWILTEANVTIGQQRIKYFTKEESFWADHINSKIPLVIADDGRVTYSMDGNPAYAKVKIDKGDLVFIFSEETGIEKSSGTTLKEIKEDENVKVSNFTIYEFSIQGDQFLISRNDPAVEEEYIFERQ